MCVCICYHASSYTPHLYIENEMSWPGFFTRFETWLLLKKLCLKVLVSSADHCFLPRSLTTHPMDNETAVTSFQSKQCVQLAVVPTAWLSHHWSVHTSRLASWLSALCVSLLMWCILHSCMQYAFLWLFQFIVVYFNFDKCMFLPPLL